MVLPSKVGKLSFLNRPKTRTHKLLWINGMLHTVCFKMSVNEILHESRSKQFLFIYSKFFSMIFALFTIWERITFKRWRREMTQNDSFRTSSLGTCSLKKNIHLKNLEISYIKTVKSIFNLMLTGRVHWQPIA